MQVKVSEASGHVLDWLVCRAQHPKASMSASHVWLPTSDGEDDFLIDAMSTDHTQGGPLMDREFISTSYDYAWVYDPDNVDPDDVPDNGDRWYAEIRRGSHDFVSDYGPTRLVAAMRCYVTSKLGAVVEVPDDLL